jgi:protein O-GlcNAc transferase
VHGIGPQRLALGFHSPPWDVFRGMDIGLDCFPHNSGTTLFETLYMGVPFVTLADRPSVGRLGSSILHGVGHPEWIARTEAEYVEIAVALATNLTSLSHLRGRLRAEMEASPLRDEAGFARRAEEAYRHMFALWAERSGLAP